MIVVEILDLFRPDRTIGELAFVWDAGRR